MSALNQMNVNTNIGIKDNMFRATKVWNEILYSFYIGISLKSHRKHMRKHYNCFVASHAVNWLTRYLQTCPHFTDQQISRFQALNLLRKYLKLNIIEKVDSRKTNYDFQDNKDLYRFTKYANENLPFISNTTHNCQTSDSTLKVKSEAQNVLVLPELSLTERSEAFKQIFFKNFGHLMPKVNDFVKIDEIIPLILMHNLTRISNNGVVQLTDKSEDLPHWVMSAMKCLANWPKASGSGSCLPKYPGFENDVFAVITDYFVNIGIPLIPNQLYPLVIAVFDLFSNDPILNYLKCPNISPIVSASDKLKKQINNDLMTSTPIQENQIQTTVELPPNHVYETVFMGDIPVTKIVSIDELTNLFKINTKQILRHSHSFSHKHHKPLRKVPSNENIDNDKPIDEKSRYFRAVTTMPRKSKALLKSPIATNIYKTTFESPKSDGSNSSAIGYYNFGFALQSPTEDGQYMLNKSVSSLSSIHPMVNFHNEQNEDLSAHLTKHNDSSKRSKTNISNNNDQNLLKTLQLSLFLMPPSNRRHLHLLLRLLSKIIHNKEIKLNISGGITLKTHILNVFTRSILCSAKESDYNELKSNKIVCLLIDYCKEIFQVPDHLISEVEALLVEKSKQKILTKNGPQYYCEQITSDEFELQRDVMSEYALSDLLRSIMTDENLSDRDKLKWIKQFKSYHPEVYDLYFTNQVRVTNPIKENAHKSCSTIRSNNSNILKRFLSIRL